MGQLVFQATLGGQVNLVGPNTASTFNLNVPATSSTLATLTGTETFTNKTLTTPVISTISNTGTLTLPTSTDTLVGRATTDTLTNKTLTTPVISSLSSAAATALTLQSAGTTAITVDTSQNVGIGTASPTNKLHVSSSSFETIKLQGTSTVSGINFVNSAYSNGYIYYDNGPNMLFYTNGSERMRIDSSGDLLVGKTSQGVTTNGYEYVPTYWSSTAGQLAVTGNSSSNSQNALAVYSTAGSAYRFYVSYGGNIYATNIVITAISDQRLKENVRDIETGLDAIMALKPRRFDWKEGKGQDKKNAAGFIAQEFAEIFPASVSVGRAGGDGVEYLNMNHEELIPSLVKAIQEQQALITAQAETINALTARIVALEAK